MGRRWGYFTIFLLINGLLLAGLTQARTEVDRQQTGQTLRQGILSEEPDVGPQQDDQMVRKCMLSLRPRVDLQEVGEMESVLITAKKNIGNLGWATITQDISKQPELYAALRYVTYNGVIPRVAFYDLTNHNNDLTDHNNDLTNHDENSDNLKHLISFAVNLHFTRSGKQPKADQQLTTNTNVKDLLTLVSHYATGQQHISDKYEDGGSDLIVSISYGLIVVMPKSHRRVIVLYDSKPLFAIWSPYKTCLDDLDVEEFVKVMVFELIRANKHHELVESTVWQNKGERIIFKYNQSHPIPETVYVINCDKGDDPIVCTVKRQFQRRLGSTPQPPPPPPQQRSQPPQQRRPPIQLAETQRKKTLFGRTKQKFKGAYKAVKYMFTGKNRDRRVDNSTPPADRLNGSEAAGYIPKPPPYTKDPPPYIEDPPPYTKDPPPCVKIDETDKTDNPPPYSP